MRLRRFFLICGLMLGLSACQEQTLYDIQNQRITVHPNQVVVVTYWASWCQLCKHNVEILNQLQKKNDSTVLVLAIDIDESENEVQAHFAEQYQMHYALLRKGQRLAQVPVPSNIPTTYILSPHAHILGTQFEGLLDLEILQKRIAEMEQK